MSEGIHVAVSNVVKIYKAGSERADVAAVNGISLEVPFGQFLSIMGASGSGKTTLLHIMAGLTNCTSGEVAIGGTCISRMTDRELTLFRRKNIGMVFQSFNLIPTLTAEENVMLPVLAGYEAKGLDKERLSRSLNELLERLNIWSRRRHYPDALSGGEQQRVAIARALLLDYATETKGSLLLADEPTGNLDSGNGEVICSLLRELCQERGHTMIVVTHEPAVARWTDRVVILKDGKIVKDVNVEEMEASKWASC